MSNKIKIAIIHNDACLPKHYYDIAEDTFNSHFAPYPEHYQVQIFDIKKADFALQNVLDFDADFYFFIFQSWHREITAAEKAAGIEGSYYCKNCIDDFPPQYLKFKQDLLELKPAQLKGKMSAILCTEYEWNYTFQGDVQRLVKALEMDLPWAFTLDGHPHGITDVRLASEEWHIFLGSNVFTSDDWFKLKKSKIGDSDKLSKKERDNLLRLDREDWRKRNAEFL